MAPPAKPSAATAVDLGLYAVTLVGWGTSWFAITLQLGVVPPEVSLIWRFAVAAAVMFGWALAAGIPLRRPAADHARFALVGVLMFSTNFALFYYAAQHLVSGLPSVVFSLASLLNMVLSGVLLGTPVERRVLAGAAVGMTGVALMFWPEVAGHVIDGSAALGLGLSLAATLCFCLGNVASVALRRREVPVVAANAWGMAYGVGWLTVLALAQGHAFAIEQTPAYLGSLVWLAIPSTVLAFAAYVRLLGRLGAARAGYATATFPVIALAISTYAEGYVWTLPAVAGLALVIAGNVAVLTAPRRG